MRHALHLFLFFFAFICLAAAEPYNLRLDDHGHVLPQTKTIEAPAVSPTPVVAPEPVFHRLSPFRNVPQFTDQTPIWGYRNRWLKPNIQDTYEVQLQAMAYFNHDIDAYHLVDVVELTVMRDGNEEFQLIDNIASNRRVSVSVPNLQEGDAYRAKIFWVDGSYRTVESVINVYADIRPIIDEPDFLAPPYW